MPCSDSCSVICLGFVSQGDHESLRSCSFAKITCGKAIGQQSWVQAVLINQPLSKLLELDWLGFKEWLPALDEEDEFLAYIEFDAFKQALRAYVGDVLDLRSELVAIDYTAEECLVKLNVKPPQGMPKIIACGASYA